MRKVLLYCIALVSLSIYILSMSPSFMKFFVRDWNNRYRPALLHYDKYKYGDLYGISYLPGYKIPVEGAYAALQKQKVSSSDSIECWVIGDSFLKTAYATDSGAFSTDGTVIEKFFWYGHDKDPVALKLEGTRRKVLLIEMNERFIAHYLHPSNWRGLLDCYVPETEMKHRDTEPFLLSSRIVPKDIEQNIETMLFGYEMFGPAKTAKAGLGKMIGTPNDGVYESASQHRLYLKSTVDASKQTSSFYHFSEADARQFDAGINQVRKAYLDRGFDEVVFAFIPNAVTITPVPGMTYSGLIPMMQQDSLIAGPYVDVYSAMMQSDKRDDLYWRTDSHWNAHGFAIWMNLFREKMESLKHPARVETGTDHP